MTNSLHGNEHAKRWVFRRLQKTGRDGVDMTWCCKTTFRIQAAVI